ncbi:TetR family transcriptional regulator [Lichenicoccus sp.]|uniref:TetR family transcriptional regulator n=1 Tax=Lichenicoccus sp. TaxID=2781899 RepID=UPI003D0D0D0E
MDDAEFDSTLLRTAMTQAEALGWRRVTVTDAAREAGLPLDRARTRYPAPAFLLARVGLLADQAALAVDAGTGSTREKLFDVLMRRFDVLQQYRAGLRTVLRALPLDPALALMLAAQAQTSMRWMAQTAGLDTTGIAGALRVAGVFGVWMQALRAWERDDSADLSGTMAALDRALDRAESFGRFLGSTPAAPAAADEPLGETFVAEAELPPEI